MRGLAEVDRWFAGFSAELAEVRNLHAGLERRARNYFRGYRSFLKFLRRSPAIAVECADPNKISANSKS